MFTNIALTFVFRSINIDIIEIFVFPCFFTKVFKFILPRMKSRDVLKNLLYIFQFLLEQNTYVEVISFCFFGRSKLIELPKKNIHIFVSPCCKNCINRFVAIFQLIIKADKTTYILTLFLYFFFSIKFIIILFR